MLNKILGSFLAVVFVLTAFAGTASAETAPTPSDSTIIACMKTAVIARETSLKTGFTTFTTAMSNAYTARQAALTSAWSLPTMSQVKPAVQTAWVYYKSSRKEANEAWKKTKKDAWKKFKTDAKACKVPKDANDSGNASQDVAG